jgi:hypothetical protein
MRPIDRPTSSDRISRRPGPSRLLIAAAVGAIVIVALVGGLVRQTPVGPADGVAPPVALTSATPSTTTSSPSSEVASSRAAATAGPSLASASASPTSPPPVSVVAAAAAVPSFRHVYLIVMENRESRSIVGNPAAPYINSLIARYGLATNYHAVAHPSEPNYLALFSGSTQGVTDDAVHQLARRNLVDQLEAAGKTWRVFAQNLPSGCFSGAVAHGGRDGTGTYARKHEPAISFKSIYSRPIRCAKIRDFTAFDPAAANFELIVPNLCNDMHDCSTAHGDTFLRSFMPKILGSPAMKGSVIFLTWDEGTSALGGGGKVATIVIGPTVAKGYRSATPHSHYSLVRTIESAWGLGCLNRTCFANTLSEFFR